MMNKQHDHPANGSVRRVRLLRDPSTYINEFLAWLRRTKKESASWWDVSIWDLEEYSAFLATEEGISGFEALIRLQFITNAFSRLIKMHVQLDEEEDNLGWFETVSFRFERLIEDTALSRVLFPEKLSRSNLYAYYQLLKEQFEDPNVSRNISDDTIRAEIAATLDALLEYFEDDGRIRLTSRQASYLLRQPKVDTLQGLRDTTAIAILLCTGIREAELQRLDVADMYYQLHGTPALHVPADQGCTERLIPYGNMIWALKIAEAWLKKATITDGPVLRGFYRDGKSVHPTRLGLRTIRLILNNYPLGIEGGRIVTVTPLELRRTYARRLYMAGMDLGAIQENLGVTNLNTVIDYVGKTRILERLPPSVYSYDVEKLGMSEAMYEE